MTAIDWIIVGLVALFAVFGWSLGFITGGLSLAGFALGAFIGTRLAPLVLPAGSSSPYKPLFGLVGALLVGGILSSGLQGVGTVLRRRLRTPGLAAADGLLGAVLTACLGLGLVWVAGAVALQTPQVRDLRRDIQRSFVLRQLNAALPPSGPILSALARFDPLPAVRGPAPDVAPPDRGIARDRDVDAAASSVVRVLGTACGLGVAGSGWVADPGVVVTNAHVVAGQQDTAVEADGKPPRLPARAVFFDARNDIAVLRVPDLERRALPLASRARPGDSAAILGYPQNGPFDARAGRVGETRTALSQDAYGRGPVRRRVTTLRGRVRSGNSGGPMVDDRGRVVTTIFAATVRERPRGGYGVPIDIVRSALRRAGEAVSTGPCA